jgi:hypothetical protein
LKLKSIANSENQFIKTAAIWNLRMHTGSRRDNENGSVRLLLHTHWRKSTDGREAKTELTNGREEKLGQKF